MAIDIGPGAIDRVQRWVYGYTFIDLNNPANANGTIDTVEIWANQALVGCKVGIFYLVSGTDYKCRSVATLGNVTAGSKQTFSGLSISVTTGDFIGAYWSDGRIENDTSGFAGQYYISGDHCIVDDQDTYTLLAGDAMSLYGTGEEVAAGVMAPYYTSLMQGDGY